MKRYKLIKKYPGSPEIHTVVYNSHKIKAYQNDENCVYKQVNSKTCKNYIFYSKEYIENYPKFWKQL